jgi:hypothetical protein
MRAVILALLVAAGIGFIGTSIVSAAPGGNTALLRTGNDVSSVIQVREGCGRGWHRNAFGECRRNHRWWRS